MLSVNVLFADQQDLNFYGDVRAKWHSMSDRDSHRNRMKVEAAFNMDYKMDDAWALTKIKVFANDSCTDGSDVGIALDKALIGYCPYVGTANEFYLEAGRNKLESMFESKIQYDSSFSGLHMAYNHGLNGIGIVSIHGGPHLLNSMEDEFGWIGEIGIQNLLEFPATVKYSITNWDSNYLISQFLAKYTVFSTTFYGAILKNHKQSSRATAFYVGATYGKLIVAKDWMVDVNYQNAKDNSVPVHDFSGIGCGVQLKSAYAVTDKFSLQGKLAVCERSEKQVEISAIYAW